MRRSTQYAPAPLVRVRLPIYATMLRITKSSIKMTWTCQTKQTGGRWFYRESFELAAAWGTGACPGPGGFLSLAGFARVGRVRVQPHRTLTIIRSGSASFRLALSKRGMHASRNTAGESLYEKYVTEARPLYEILSTPPYPSL